MARKSSCRFNKLKIFFNEFFEGDFFGLAAEMSFYMLSSFLPLSIFMFTLTSRISQKYTDVMLNLLGKLPDKAGNLIIEMLTNRTTSVTVMLITGAFALFSISQFILTAEKGLNRFYKTGRNRGVIVSTGLSFIFAFFVIISIIFSFALIIFGDVIAENLFRSKTAAKFIPIWNISRHIIILIFISLIISALFKALPTIKLKLRYVLPGAAFTTIGWYVASMLFALYVNNFPNYEILYGSLAGFACMIMWIYIIGILIIIGSKINALIYLHRGPCVREQKDEPQPDNQNEPTEIV